MVFFFRWHYISVFVCKSLKACNAVRIIRDKGGENVCFLNKNVRRKTLINLVLENILMASFLHGLSEKWRQNCISWWIPNSTIPSYQSKGESVTSKITDIFTHHSRRFLILYFKLRAALWHLLEMIDLHWMLKKFYWENFYNIVASGPISLEHWRK